MNLRKKTTMRTLLQFALLSVGTCLLTSCSSLYDLVTSIVSFPFELLNAAFK